MQPFSKGQRQLVQAELKLVRRFVEVDIQGKRTLHSTEVLRKLFQKLLVKRKRIVSAKQGIRSFSSTSKVEETSRELKYGATKRSSLVALGLLR